MTQYFFDTYAFFEIISGNPGYQRFAKDVECITTKWNLLELYYGLLIANGKDAAEEKYEKYKVCCVEIDDKAIKEAAKFRALNRKKRLSYVDCIGYTIARSRNALFLTGDKEFEGMIGVEFVK